MPFLMIEKIVLFSMNQLVISK